MIYHMELEDQIIHEGNCDCRECIHTQRCNKNFMKYGGDAECICEVDLY